MFTLEELSLKLEKRRQIEEHISKLKQNFKQPTDKVLQNADVKACLSDPHIVNMSSYQQIKLQTIL